MVTIVRRASTAAQGLDADGNVIGLHDHFVPSRASARSTSWPAWARTTSRRFVPNHATNRRRCRWDSARRAARLLERAGLRIPVFHRRTGARRRPLAFQLRLLGEKATVGEGPALYNAARMKGVLQAMAQMANWGRPGCRGAKGSALPVTTAMPATSQKSRMWRSPRTARSRFEKVWCAVDVGSQIVNPSGAIQQVTGLGAAASATSCTSA